MNISSSGPALPKAIISCMSVAVGSMGNTSSLTGISGPTTPFSETRRHLPKAMDSRGAEGFPAGATQTSPPVLQTSVWVPPSARFTQLVNWLPLTPITAVGV